VGNVSILWIVAGFLLFVVCIPIYFLPAINGRKKRNSFAIFALNVLLGWTVLGWIALLIWALPSDTADSGDIQAPIPDHAGIALFCDECGHYSMSGRRSCCHCGKPFEAPLSRTEMPAAAAVQGS
jgi:hypothetical protein